MSALIKNGDLKPDAAGRILKVHTFQALLRVGISEKVARETTDANFDHLADPKALNVFRMNTVKHSGKPDPPGPLEHFRSTGIRDESAPVAFRYSHFDACAAFSGDTQVFDRVDIESCANLVWDHERFGSFQSIPAILPSNDVNENKRPPLCGQRDSGLSGCDAHDPARDQRPCCRSQLHGAISFMFQEFGTPRGEHAQLSRIEMRELWLEAEYPAAFVARSPHTCVNASDLSASGCQRCLELVPATDSHGFPITAANSSEAQRYCLCIASRQLDAHTLDAIPEHSRLHCPKSPMVNSTVDVADTHVSHQRQRRLSSPKAALRDSLQRFYAYKGLAYAVADVRIYCHSPTSYQLLLATTSSQAAYLANAMRVEFQIFVAETSTDIRVKRVEVSDDLRLSTNCEPFCESRGSFLGGFDLPPLSPPFRPVLLPSAPSPPLAPPPPSSPLPLLPLPLLSPPSLPLPSSPQPSFLLPPLPAMAMVLSTLLVLALVAVRLCTVRKRCGSCSIIPKSITSPVFEHRQYL